MATELLHICAFVDGTCSSRCLVDPPGLRSIGHDCSQLALTTPPIVHDREKPGKGRTSDALPSPAASQPQPRQWAECTSSLAPDAQRTQQAQPTPEYPGTTLAGSLVALCSSFARAHRRQTDMAVVYCVVNC